MASSNDKPVNYGKRFIWFTLSIVTVIVLYTAGWHYFANRLVGEAQAAITQANRDGRRASCENVEARGYPFRIGLFCRTVMFEDARAGIRFRAMEFRSAAQVYRPNLILGELDGPATLEAPGIPSLDLHWEGMRASVRLQSTQAERVSVEGRNVEVRIDEPGDAAPLLGKAGSAEMHARPAPEGYDLALRFGDLTFDPEIVGTDKLPPLAGLADLLVKRWQSGGRESDVEIRDLTLSLDQEGSGAKISGPFSVDASGLINAELQVTLRNPKAIGALLIELMPQARREIELGVAGFAMMGDEPTLPLSIANGKVRMGFLSLGTIPPL